MSQQLSVKEVTHAVDQLLGQVPLKSMIKHDGKRDFAGSAEVVTVFSTTALLDVIKVLFKYNIASVPVVTPAGHAEEKTEKKSAVFDFWVEPGAKKQGVVLGFVDMVDILAYVISALPREEMQEALELAGRSLLESPVVNVINFSQKDKIVAIAQDHFAREALQHFAQGIHRVLLFDDSKALSGLVSQSDFIRLLHCHYSKGELQSVNFNFDKKFRELRSSVEAIRLTDTVFQAISKLGSGVLRTLAVVDANGSLIGNFSSTDVGYAFAIGRREADEIDKSEAFRTMFANFNLTVQEYLTKFHPKSLTPQICLPTITVEQVCKVMAESKIKQLWVTDDINTKVPIGVITQTDVCRQFGECISGCQPCSAARG